MCRPADNPCPTAGTYGSTRETANRLLLSDGIPGRANGTVAVPPSAPGFRCCGDPGKGRSMVTQPGTSDQASGPGLLDPAAVSAPGDKKIQGRSLSQIAWARLKRDKVAMGGGA